METLLGIDYGRKKVGFAIAETGLIRPLTVIRETSFEKILDAIEKIVDQFGVQKIIVGISESEIGKESRNFGKRLKKELGIPLEYEDETLTSYDARRFSLEAGISSAKRKKLEDAFAAAVMLENYLQRRNSLDLES